MEHNTKYKYIWAEHYQQQDIVQGGADYQSVQHKIHFTSSEQQTQQHTELHKNNNCRSYA